MSSRREKNSPKGQKSPPVPGEDEEEVKEAIYNPNAFVFTLRIAQAKELYHVQAPPWELKELEKNAKKEKKSKKKDSPRGGAKKSKKKRKNAEKEAKEEEIRYPLSSLVTFSSFTAFNSTLAPSVDVKDSKEKKGKDDEEVDTTVRTPVIHDSEDPSYQFEHKQQINDLAAFRDYICQEPLRLTIEQQFFEVDKDGNHKKAGASGKKLKKGEEEPPIIIGTVDLDLTCFLRGIRHVSSWYPIDILPSTCAQAKEVAHNRASEGLPAGPRVQQVMDKVPKLYVSMQVSRVLTTPADVKNGSLVNLSIRSVDNMPVIWRDEPIDETDVECQDQFVLSYKLPLTGERWQQVTTPDALFLAPPPIPGQEEEQDTKKSRKKKSKKKGSGSPRSGNKSKSGDAQVPDTPRATLPLPPPGGQPRLEFCFNKRHYLDDSAIRLLRQYVQTGRSLDIELLASRQPSNEKDRVKNNPLFSFSYPGVAHLDLRPLLRPGATVLQARVPLLSVQSLPELPEEEDDRKSNKKGSKDKKGSKQKKGASQEESPRVIQSYQDADTFVDLTLRLDKPLVPVKTASPLDSLLPNDTAHKDLSTLPAWSSHSNKALLDSLLSSSSSCSSSLTTLPINEGPSSAAAPQVFTSTTGFLSQAMIKDEDMAPIQTTSADKFQVPNTVTYPQKSHLAPTSSSSSTSPSVETAKIVQDLQTTVQQITASLNKVPLLSSSSSSSSSSTPSVKPSVAQVIAHLKSTGMYTKLKSQLQPTVSKVATQLFHNYLPSDVNPNQHRQDPLTLSNHLYIKVSQLIANAAAQNKTNNNPNNFSSPNTARPYSPKRPTSPGMVAYYSEAQRPPPATVMSSLPASYWLHLAHTSNQSRPSPISAFLSELVGVNEDTILNILSLEPTDRLMALKTAMMKVPALTRRRSPSLADLCELHGDIELASRHHISALSSAIEDNQQKQANVRQAKDIDEDASIQAEQDLLASNKALLRVWLQYGTFLLRRGDMDTAEECFCKALDLDNSNLTALIAYAALLLERDDPDKALAQVDAAFMAYRSHPLIVGLKGVYHSLAEEDEDHDVCMEEAQRLLDEKAQYAMNYMQWNGEEDALVVSLLGDLGHVSSLSMEGSQSIDVYVGRVLLALNLTRTASRLLFHAVKDCKANLQKASSNYSANHSGYGLYGGEVELARLYLLRNDTSQAETHLNKAFDIIKRIGAPERLKNGQVNAGILNAWAVRGDIHYEAKYFREAQQAYEHYFELYKLTSTQSGLDPVVCFRLGQMYLQKGSDYYEKAYRTFSELSVDDKYSTSSPYGWLGVGSVCLQAGAQRYAEAEKTLAEAVVLDNTNPRIWALISLLSLRQRSHILAEAEGKLKAASSRQVTDGNAAESNNDDNKSGDDVDQNTRISRLPIDDISGRKDEMAKRAYDNAAKYAQEAGQALHLALKHQVTDIPLLTQIADLCEDGGDLLAPMAELALRRAVKLDPNTNQARLRLDELLAGPIENPEQDYHFNSMVNANRYEEPYSPLQDPMDDIGGFTPSNMYNSSNGDQSSPAYNDRYSHSQDDHESSIHSQALCCPTCGGTDIKHIRDEILTTERNPIVDQNARSHTHPWTQQVSSYGCSCGETFEDAALISGCAIPACVWPDYCLCGCDDNIDEGGAEQL